MAIFRLQPVLRIRERLRETQRLAFAAVEDERVRLVNEILRLEERVTSVTQEMGRVDNPKWSIMDLQLYGDFIQHLTQVIQRKRVLLSAVEDRRETRRLALLEADKDVKSLEQLRTRLDERHEQEEATRAQQQTDEVGQRIYIKQQKAASGKKEA